MPPSTSFTLSTLSEHISALMLKGLNDTAPSSLGALSPSQNRAVLITGLVCGTLSFVAALVAVRWFALMKKSFRHRLIFFLIVSDTFKAFWYFVFPIIMFAKHGDVKSHSAFCQASGFWLSFAIESSDFAILMIAIHSILYICRPPQNTGEGGLYPYRHWIYVVWLGLPLTMASLAFVNSHDAYVTAGTYCYLPKRPFWYRLALSWIPRYIILIAILVMYGSLYVYVMIKFKGFRNLGNGGTSYSASSESQITSSTRDSENPSPTHSPQVPNRPTFSRQPSTQPSILMTTNRRTSDTPTPREPWDNVSFITSKHLQDPSAGRKHLSASALASREFGSASTEKTRVEKRPSVSFHFDSDHLMPKTRRQSEAPTFGTNHTVETQVTGATKGESIEPDRNAEAPMPISQLDVTRLAIRRQLRYLFIYPLVYLLMWTFPFVNHCFQYSDYYTAHPVFWLAVINTLSVSLQAGVDCVIFSWREKPWRKIDSENSFSIPVIYKNSKSLLGWTEEKAIQRAERRTERQSVSTSTRTSSHWWEAEGMRRQDSLWADEDAITRISSTNSRTRGSIFRHFTRDDPSRK